MRRGWGRVGLRLVACLGAGVVVTVAVAWGCALWAPLGSGVSSACAVQTLVDEVGLVRHRLKARALPRWWHREEVLTARVITGEELVMRGCGVRTVQLRAVVGPPVCFLAREDRRVCVIECGFPFASFGAAADNFGVGDIRSRMRSRLSYVWSGGVAAPEWLRGREMEGPIARQPRPIPVKALWAGFAGNVVVYAGALYGLCRSGAWARARARRAQGRCAGCGYDLSGSVEICPECGRGR